MSEEKFTLEFIVRKIKQIQLGIKHAKLVALFEDVWYKIAFKLALWRCNFKRIIFPFDIVAWGTCYIEKLQNNNKSKIGIRVNLILFLICSEITYTISSFLVWYYQPFLACIQFLSLQLLLPNQTFSQEPKPNTHNYQYYQFSEQPKMLIL